MASLESRLFHRFLRLIGKKRFLELQFAFDVFDFYNCKEPPKEILNICNVRQYQSKGRNVFELSPRDSPSTKHILYLHGGAYVQGFVKLHWKFMSRLVEQTQCTVTAPDYPLAPSHTYADSYEMVRPVYAEIAATVGVDNFIVMGDSAGGGFALALAQQGRNQNIGTPAKIVLLCPWLDVSLTNPAIERIDKSDPFLSVTALRKAGVAYAGDVGVDNFMVSPIHGGFHGLGEIYVFAGSYDVLVADARKMKVLAEADGTRVHYIEYPKMVHMWMFMNFPEARMAQLEILDCLRA